MILLTDIGNSNIVLAIVENDKVLDTFRLKTNTDKTSDEYYVSIKGIVKEYSITDVIISSVVPVITSALKKVFVRIYDNCYNKEKNMLEFIKKNLLF